MQIGNLFEAIPPKLRRELIDTLVAAPGIRIERIVSHGQHSPPDFWYDQDDDEWVVLLKGAAAVRFEVEGRLLQLTEGMHVHIRAHERHRVEWTAENVDTVWLAVFFPAV